MRPAPAAAAGSLLPLLALTLACGDRAATAPAAGAPAAPAAALVRPPLADPDPAPADGPATLAVVAPRVARVAIAPASLPLLYASLTDRPERDLVAIAYDSAGNVLADRAVTWTDETGWNPGLALGPTAGSSIRIAFPYPNAAAPVRTPSGECPLEWKGIRATIDGVSALAPVCGTFTVAVSAERRTGLVPVAGDTIVLGAGQQCRVQALASGGYGFYDYVWSLDGTQVGFGPTLVLDTGPAASHVLVLRVSDEGHDIAPWREMRFVLLVDGGGREELDC